jgi:CDP-diacylglycerol pyrophosphatase
VCEAVALAINSRYARSQNQLHVHVDSVRAHLGAMSLGVIGADFAGRRGFILLADVFSLEGGGHAEDLQDHDCAIAKIAP